MSLLHQPPLIPKKKEYHKTPFHTSSYFDYIHPPLYRCRSCLDDDNNNNNKFKRFVPFGLVILVLFLLLLLLVMVKVTVKRNTPAMSSIVIPISEESCATTLAEKIYVQVMCPAEKGFPTMIGCTGYYRGSKNGNIFHGSYMYQDRDSALFYCKSEATIINEGEEECISAQAFCLIKD